MESGHSDRWTKWSSIAEIISSIAVLVTIVFLVIETRQNNDSLAQNTQAILSNGTQNAMQAELDWLYKGLDNPELSTALIPPFEDGLSRNEKVRRISYAAVMFRMRENSWTQYKIGAIDQGAWKAYMTSFGVMIDSDPYGQWLWDNMNGQLDPDFINAVNEFRSGQ